MRIDAALGYSHGEMPPPWKKEPWWQKNGCACNHPDTAGCWTTPDWQRYEGSILGWDQYNQLQLNRQARNVGMNGVSLFEKEREGGGGGEGGLWLWVEDWIICGLAERQLVCFVLEVLDKKQDLLYKKKKKSLPVFNSVMDSNHGHECDIYISLPIRRLKTVCVCFLRYIWSV